MSYKIFTDTCCDLPEAMCQQLDLHIVNMTLNFRGEEHNRFSAELLQQLYDGMRNGESGSTAAINPAGWSEAIEPELQQGNDVLVLAFSSGLSTTYQSAVIAAEELSQKYPERKVRVVDTLCASMGQGLIVYYACRKRDEGMALDDLCQWCEDHKLNLCHWFTVDNLMHLKRGGRVSAATALVGTMLQIKPVLHVDDEGHLISVSKARGRKASIEALAKKAAELALPGENDVMFISHGDCESDAQILAARLKEMCGVKEVIIGYIGAVIGSHSGPGTLAVFFMGSKR